MKGHWKSVALVVMVNVSVVGCADSTVPTGTATRAGNVPGKYVLATEPDNVTGVIAARKETKDGDTVAVVGRIGGSEKPFVDGMAAFTIVDLSLMHCPADEGCPTPWDYCCDTDKLPQRTAMVKIVDESGKTVGSDARELLGVKELTAVVAKGTAKRDETGNLTVLADHVFIRQ